ncbi:hypothetical protein [Pseudoalteromonas distincta]|uniref:hypothetical protein n=1 Tax=Pseudoalteromonas distincta TaxID=77608 RepID=UPI00186A2EA5|nr:hypothetical protein [Pseudoalteromonas distincta]MBE3673999.1 hypothetical protein [Pseudoalteromonas distincta KMM 3548]
MHFTGDDKELIKAFRKSFLTFLGGGVLGFFAVSIMKYLTVNHSWAQLLVLMALELLVLIMFLRYRNSSPTNKALYSSYKRYIKRELLKSFFNSFLMFYTFYGLYFAFSDVSTIQRAWWVVRNSYYNCGLILNIIFVLLTYLASNTILNFITSNSEKIDAKIKEKITDKAKKEQVINVSINNS